MTSDVPPPPPSGQPGRSRRLPRGRLLALAGTTVVVVALAVALVVSFTGGGSHDGGGGASRLAGRAMPAVPLHRLDATGTPVTLARLADGRPSYVNVWSSTCVPCKKEMPAIEAVYRKLGDRVAFVGVDVEDTVGRAQQFLRQHGATYPQVRDPRAELPSALGYQAIPLSVFVDGHGRIVDFRLGALSESQLRGLLEKHFGVAT